VNVALEIPVVRVIDDILPAADFAAVASLAAKLDYGSTVYGTSIWRQEIIENPLGSGLSVSWYDQRDHKTDDMAIAGPDGLGRRYPTGTWLDPALEMIRNCAAKSPNLIGKYPSDWWGLTCRLYAYGAGTRADWHTDAAGYTGAFVYYVHPLWNRSWGGDLLVRVDDMSLAADCGIFVTPRPNRLVLLKAGTEHAVSRLSSAIGSGFRRSMSGFFVTRARLEELKAESERRSTESQWIAQGVTADRKADL